jgi:hypothetical protein
MGGGNSGDQAVGIGAGFGQPSEPIELHPRPLDSTVNSRRGWLKPPCQLGRANRPKRGGSCPASSVFAVDIAGLEWLSSR